MPPRRHLPPSVVRPSASRANNEESVHTKHGAVCLVYGGQQNPLNILVFHRTLTHHYLSKSVRRESLTAIVRRPNALTFNREREAFDPQLPTDSSHPAQRRYTMLAQCPFLSRFFNLNSIPTCDFPFYSSIFHTRRVPHTVPIIQFTVAPTPIIHPKQRH